jgi:mannitol 2-dehydrogenase
MEEVTPTLEAVPGMDLTVYKDTLVSRFSNKNIRDTILRLASQGSSKIPNFMLKPLSDAVRAGLPHSSMLFALASWARFLSGKDEQGKDIPLDDVNGPTIVPAAGSAQKDPKAFLIRAGIANLGESQLEKTAETFKSQLDLIYQKGIKAALEEFLGNFNS